MIVGAHQRVEVDDIHDTHFDARHVFLQQPRCGASLDCGDIAGARENDVGFRAAVVRRKFPDRRSLRTMGERFVKREPLQFRLLSAGDDIHIIPAAQAVVEYVQQAV